MARKKLHRIEEATVLPNIIQHDNPNAKTILADFLMQKNNVFLELGCGRGEYTVGLSALFPDAACLGMDIQGERIWHGAKYALEQKKENILFFRGGIEKISEILPPHSIDEIWIPFPDPFPRKKKAKKRLTSPRFLEMYALLLKPNGIVNLKTDNEDLFWYTKETIETFGAKILSTDTDLNAREKNPKESIQTQYEKRFTAEGKKIFLLSFTLN